jgi:hypothetical protein
MPTVTAPVPGLIALSSIQVVCVSHVPVPVIEVEAEALGFFQVIGEVHLAGSDIVRVHFSQEHVPGGI